MKQLKHKHRIRSKYQLLFLTFCISIVVLAFLISPLLKQKSNYTLKFSDKIEAPIVDVGSCYSTKAIKINLTPSNPDYQVYYTLDGTEPNSGSLKVDDNSIWIDEKVTKETFLYSIPTSPRWKPPVGDVFCFKILRAVCVDENGNKGKELQASYIIDKSKTHNYTLPVFSFIFNPDDVFGYKNGIYIMGKSYEDKDNYVKKKIKFDIPWWRYPANYLQKGSNSDRPIFADYFCLNEGTHFSFESKMRIHGFNTRGFAQKSVRVPVKTIDSSCVTMFNNQEMNFIFRNGGNDWTKTLLRDAFIHEVMKGSTLSPQAYQPVVCFFNGEYWGIHTLRERFDELYIQSKYGISKDSIAIVELGGDVMAGSKSEGELFNNLMNFISENDMSKELNYKIVEEQIDIANLIEYLIANIYFVNNDWPQNNLKYWRYSYPAKDSSYRNNKWRFVLSDMDWAMGFNITDAHDYNMFNFLKNKKPFGETFYKLLQNESFKKQFVGS
ncbi:MAG: CotH kinase family protein, partial [Bacteroidia bacterium]|nr:CotH kinase family protein [Bacteroidia bacterium]